MEITTEVIKALRDKTGISVMQCKKALEETGGDMDKALALLQKKSGEAALKKSDRTLAAGVVSAYVHSNREVGTLLTLSCETDFVAKNEEFVELAYAIAMHAAAMRPRYISRDEIPADELAMLRESYRKEVEGKPADIQDKILDGKVDAALKLSVLLEQPFIKDDTKLVRDLLTAAVQKFGERTEVTQLSVFSTR